MISDLVLSVCNSISSLIPIAFVGDWIDTVCSTIISLLESLGL